MLGLSVKLWEEEGEEDFCLLLPGLTSVTILLDALLKSLANEVAPKDFALLSSHIPSSLLAPSKAVHKSWSSAATWKKTQQNLKEHTKNKQQTDKEHVKNKQQANKEPAVNQQQTDSEHTTKQERTEDELTHKTRNTINETETPTTPNWTKEGTTLTKDASLSVEEVADLDFISDLMETDSDTLVDTAEEKEVDEEWEIDNSIARLENDLSTRKPRTEFECNVCGDIFPLLKELKTHQEASHKELFCGKCGTASPSLELVSLHNCSKPHCCQVCHRLFSSSHELKSHSYIHSGEKPHQCDHCGKGFRQRATLDRHKLTHQTKRNFECDVCGKKFKFKHYLVSHKLLHSGDKPHMCTWCGMTFTQNANMQKHVRMKHTNSKDHVCRYCGKSFVQAYYLRRHLTTHREAVMEKATLAALVETHTSSDEQVGIRTVACRLCSATCKGERELVDHMERKHGRSEGILLKAGLVEQLERQQAEDSESELLKMEAEVQDGVVLVAKLEEAAIS